jgi:hypothetical protein
MANLHFDQGLKMLGAIFDHVINTYSPRARATESPIHVSITPQKPGRCLLV